MSASTRDTKPPGPCPVPLELTPEGIPSELRERPEWVIWQYRWVRDRWTKVPLGAMTGRQVNVTNPKALATFEEAVEGVRKFRAAGVGLAFMSGGPYTGVDLDECYLEEGELSPEAAEIIGSLDTYTEKSPGGQGVKLIARAKKPPRAKCRSTAIGGMREIEIYDGDRYFALTGHHLSGCPTTIEPRLEQVQSLCERIWLPTPRTQRKAPAARVALSDDELVTKAKDAKNGPLFSRLWSGDTSDYGGDDSRADLALCSLLAWWTGPDPTRIDRLLRRSGLFREKWNRDNYRDQTIAKALEGRTEYYAPSGLGPGPVGLGDKDGPPPSQGGRAALTDLGNAERFERAGADQLRYCHARGRWYVWDERRWREDAKGIPMLLAGQTSRSIVAEAKGLGTKAANAVRGWAHVSESRTRLDAMVILGRSRPGLVLPQYARDGDPMLLNLLNGTMDLRTGKLRSHTRGDLITKLAPVEYRDSAPCPLFMKFLERAFAGNAALIAYVKRLLGMCLTGDIREQILPVFYGPGANGKSVLLDTVMGVMGDYASPAAPNLLVETRFSEHPTELADLCGRRLVVASESERGATLKLQLVKRLTGDKIIKARFMRQDYFQFNRTHKIILATNNRPRVAEDSEAAWRRIKLVPFDVIIPPEERDPELLVKLQGEWPGILFWLLQGCIEWQFEGLGEPEAVAQATGAYRSSEDAFGRFLAERCVLEKASAFAGPVWFTPYTQLRDAYEQWAGESGESTLSETDFRDALDKQGLRSDQRRHAGRSCKGRLGVRLADLVLTQEER